MRESSSYIYSIYSIDLGILIIWFAKGKKCKGAIDKCWHGNGLYEWRWLFCRQIMAVEKYLVCLWTDA